MAPTRPVRIYTDGNCPFCLWARNVVEPQDRERRLEFRDFNQPVIAAETPFPLEHLRREMYVQTPEGQWHRGYWAWEAVLSAIPRYRWLARAMRWVPFRWLGPALYKLFADNRYRIPSWFLRLLGAPQPCGESCSLSQSM